MKRFVFATLCVSILLCGCNNPVEPKQEEGKVDTLVCEDVTSPSDLPWIEEMIQHGLVLSNPYRSDTFPVEYVDKVFYTTPESEEEYVAFIFEWRFPSGSADAAGAALLDCDGERLATYGGWTGCEGLCDITITSKKRIYEIERSPQEKCERAIRGEWVRINEEGRNEKFAFCTIRPIGSEGELDYYLADLLLSEHSAVAGTTVTLRYSITPPDSLHIKLQLKGASEPRWAYTTHYSITNDTLLTLDSFARDGKNFTEMIELSLKAKY